MTLKLHHRISKTALARFLMEAVYRVRSVTQMLNASTHIAIDEYIQKHLHENPKYASSKRLNRFEFQVYSQSGEDGIIEEIFNRISTTNRCFVEFGASNGLMNNTAYLLIKHWTGYWLEASARCVKTIHYKFEPWISQQLLGIRRAFVTAENIEALFKQARVPVEFDLLSIDIDGNDYWVWQAIENYHPRVVVIEYNALYPPTVQWVREYTPHATWSGSSYLGASLKSLEVLGLTKGYRLVGCNFAGTNAFFVHQDLVADHFFAPFDAQTHYEPLRYYLIRNIGHRRDFGKFVSV